MEADQTELTLWLSNQKRPTVIANGTCTYYELTTRELDLVIRIQRRCGRQVVRVQFREDQLTMCAGGWWTRYVVRFWYCPLRPTW